MTVPIQPPADLYLREEVIRGGMDLLFFAHSRHLRHSDMKLEELGLGRAHHRVLYFLARRPDIPMGDLLSILAITKQSFGRVSRQLTALGLLASRVAEHDRRQRLLRLTDAGTALEKTLFDVLQANMAQAYAASGSAAVSGYWTMLQHLMGDEARGHFAALCKDIARDPARADAATAGARLGAAKPMESPLPAE